MADLTPQERLQPCLLDRLADDEPEEKQESRERRVVSVRKLRESVLRDLGWLLNSAALPLREEVERYSEVPRSVLNFGMPALAGNTANNMDMGEVERMLRQVIRDFEPRIIGSTVRVHATLDEAAMSHNALTFEIEGELWAQPLPEHLYLKTIIDLEGGKVSLLEANGSDLS
ncbi:MAG: type VI secretion system baseplate subunit TssE [Gammaproteobacteria bacterium]|nr:type VI secretion system baseplate subunit TssE [Gammaproteobacteria bacterium]MCP5425487.1 type VI secretion system baseplate subunit TssE [Gammaproteobacteria bacterium]